MKLNSTDMASFKALAILSSIFLTFVQLDNAVPLHGLIDEINTGKYNDLVML